MPIHLDKAKNCWRFSFNRVVSGRRVRASKLLPQGWTRTQAQAYEQKETTRLFSIATGSIGDRRTIEDAIEIYCRERLPQLKAGKNQLSELAQAHWAYAGRYIDELPEVAREYDSAMNGELSPATIRNRMAYVRAACRYAFKYHKFGEHDPAERLVLPQPKNERHHYSDRRQVLQIARAITNRSARIAVLIAFYSGMRLGEVLKCKVVDGSFLLEETKNGTRRMVPIHPKLESYLRRVPIKAAYRTIQGCHKRACQALGIGHLHFHDMRHSAASEMINAGIDLYTVGGVLGHKSAQSTKRYSHLSTETLGRAVASIGRKQK